jgi:hypothetical protein
MIGPGGQLLRRGLGTLWVVDSSGKTIDCDALSNFFNSACWGSGTSISELPPGSPVFGAGGTTPQPSQVDCSQFWNALTSSQCSFSGWTASTLILPVAAVAGLLLFLTLRK